MLHHFLQAWLEAITEIVLLVFVIRFQSLACVNCSKIKYLWRIYQTAVWGKCNSELYLYVDFMGCAERPLPLSAQFQLCGDNRSFTYRCTFGFRLLTQLHWLSLWWILLVMFMKFLLHISDIIHLLILGDTDICGLYENEISVRLATHQYMWHHCKINEYYIISIWKCLLNLEILSISLFLWVCILS